MWSKNPMAFLSRFSFPRVVSSRRHDPLLNLAKDEIQVLVRTATQPGEESGLQLQEFLCNAGKIPSIHKQAAYDEDGLVVWLGRVVKLSEIPGFINETDFQERLSKKTLATR